MSVERDPDSIPEEELVPEDDAIIGTVFRWSLLFFAVVGVGIVGWLLFSRSETPVEEIVDRGTIEAPPALRQPTQNIPRVGFREVSQEAGIDFVHESGARGEKLLPETMGGGVAFLDYDRDGDADLLFVNSNRWSDEAGPAPTMALYRNDGQGRFEDVTRAAGLDRSFYGQGVAVGDYDNDGLPDLYFTALGKNHLFRNRGGTFEDVTSAAGVAGGESDWSSSAGFFDYDLDGDLDLFVCNYVQWSRDQDIRLNFSLNGTDRAYGPPTQYRGAHSALYRNDGNGAFTDVSEQAGIRVAHPATGGPMGKALAVTFADLDDDLDPDIVVANDTVQNFAFRNNGDGTFDEMGARSGIGFDSMGNATGAMGIDTADYLDDGLLGIGIGNFAAETTSFYVQQRDPWQFVDMANAEGIGSPSRLHLSFGLFFFDYDLDGRLDLLQANGHLEDEINEIQPSQHYRQATQLFWNVGSNGKACFAAVPSEELGDLGRPIVGRGASYADMDADGDLDVVVAQTGGPPLVVRNEQDLGHHWLRVRLEGTSDNRDAIGARVRLVADGRTQTRTVMPTRSYLSQVELPLTFGLGTSTEVERLQIRWPSGAEQDVDVDGIDRELVIRQR